MKPTNYHLFDFLDFDPESVKRLSRFGKHTSPRLSMKRTGISVVNSPLSKASAR